MKPRSDAVRDEVWGHLLDICRFHRYLLILEGRYNRYKKYGRMAVYIGTSGVVGSLVGQSAIATTIFSLTITVIVILDHVFDLGEKTAKYHHARLGISSLESKYRELWVEVNRDSSSITAEEALSRSREILNDTDRYSALIDKTDEKLTARCETETYETESERYA